MRFLAGDLDLLFVLTDFDLDRLWVDEADLERFLRTGDSLLDLDSFFNFLGEGDCELTEQSS